MSLGCQIAPDYEHGDDSSSSSSSYDSDEEHQQSESQSDSQHEPKFEDIHTPIEQIQTAQDKPPTRPATLQQGRTKSARGETPPLAPAGFWHIDMSGVRRHVILLWAKTNLILSIAIMAFLCIYWGALFNQSRLSKSIGVWVVDFDGQMAPYQDEIPLVGPFVTDAIQQITDSPGAHPGYHIRSPADFDSDPIKVRESVFDFKAYAAVIINPNATALLRAAVFLGNTTYDPKGACHLVYVSARDQSISSTIVIPSFTALQNRVTAGFAMSWVPSVLRNSSISGDHLEKVPQAISPAIGFTTYDLRPFGPSVATPAISVGLIYLIILSFFSFTFFLPIHMKYLQPKGHPPLIFHHLIIWRYVATVASYFILSLVYSLVSLAYLMPMSNAPASHVEPAVNPNAYHHATFMVFWMLNFVAMTAFGIACENMAMFLGSPWAALWLVFWVITNVSTGFYPLSLESNFYRWGYAWPMHNLVEATRSILFDLHPRIGLNVGILLAWCAVDTVLFPFACYYMRWMGMRTKKKKAEKEAKWQARMQKEREDPGLISRITTIGSRPAK